MLLFMNVSSFTSPLLHFHYFVTAGPILESKGMRVIFQRKEQKNFKKGKIFENLGKNIQNFKVYWKSAGNRTQ